MDTTLTLSQGKLNLIFAWFGSCFLTLFLGLISLIYLSDETQVTPTPHAYRLYQALPSNQIVMTDEIKAVDSRVKIVENFFKSYNSALVDYSEEFVSVADKYDLDYRLLPAIAMQESSGGKRVPAGSNNPFGFGIYGSKLLKFISWEEAIEVVGRSLREEYLSKGLNTPEEIMTKYTPPSLEKGGAWAKGVNSFMGELK